MGWCVLVEDLLRSSGLAESLKNLYTCRFIRIQNPRSARAIAWAAGVNAGILTALSWICANTDADFILRIDTDALAIAPFADKIRSFMADTPNAGILGALGLSCNPDIRQLQALNVEPDLLRLHRRLPTSLSADGSPTSRAVQLSPTRCVRITAAAIDAFNVIRPHIDAAITNGYTSSIYCQGGACAITRHMLDLMVSAGYLDNPDAWLQIPVNDDMVLAMYAHAVKLAVSDFSGPDQPFGVQFRALPYSLDELVERDYGLIHSLRGDPRYSESEIRTFFLQRALDVDPLIPERRRSRDDRTTES